MTKTITYIVRNALSYLILQFLFLSNVMIACGLEIVVHFPLLTYSILRPI